MSFRVFEGVVESRADPLQLGRCKVRVVGVHTEDTNILPTKDLPWAMPMQPIFSAAVSGIGRSPTGIVESTWVYVFFSDGESKQQPVMMGTIAGIPESQKNNLTDPNKSTDGTKYDGLRDETSNDGSSVDDSNQIGNSSNNNSSSNQTNDSGDQVLTQDGSNTSSNNFNNQSQDSEYKLGQISKKYESGNAGAGTVSSGKGDYGGVSYGTHQLASFRDSQGASKGSASSNAPVQQFVNSSKWKNEFAGMTPGTSSYSNKWKEIAKNEPEEFEHAQYQYFKGQYYNNGVNQIRAGGIDVTRRGNAVQEMVWSTSIQYGPAGARKVFVRALDGKDVNSMSDAQIIEAVQNDKHKNVDTDFKSSSAAVKNGVRSRTQAEKADLLRLAGDDGVNKDNPTEEEVNEDTHSKPSDEYHEDATYEAPDGAKPDSGVSVPTTPDSNPNQLGFQDPYENYPRTDWLNESDVSRLSRHDRIEKTIIRAKRNSLVSGVSVAGGGFQWNEPQSPYDAKYPLNHVFESESGHVQEYDDTPNAERIHIYHRAGSFIEWHPDGTVIYKSVKDQFEVTVADRNIYVGGTCNITVNGDTNIYTKGVHRMESDGDMFIKTKSNMRIGAMGTLHMESNGEMYVGSQSNLNEAGSNIFMNCAWSAASVMAGGFPGGEIAVEAMYDVEAIVPSNLEDEVIKELNNNGEIDNSTDDANASSGNAPTETDGATNEEDTEQGEDATEETPPCEGCCQYTKEEEITANMKLSANFTLSDLSTSAVYPHTVRAQGSMSRIEIVNNLCNVANNVLEPLVAKYGRSSFIITSGFRAGSGSSQHLKGEAVDIQFTGLSHSAAAQRAEDISKILNYDQMILEWHGRNPVFHISHGSRSRKQKLTTPNLKNYFDGFRHKDMSKL